MSQAQGENIMKKLITGNMNIPFKVCKPGYAEGAKRPQQVIQIKPMNPVIVTLRKARVA